MIHPVDPLKKIWEIPLESSGIAELTSKMWTDMPHQNPSRNSCSAQENEKRIARLAMRCPASFICFMAFILAISTCSQGAKISGVYTVPSDA